jgi:hypothetical protein
VTFHDIVRQAGFPAAGQVKILRNGTFQKGETMAPAQRCNVYDAEPIPEAARAEIDRLLKSGDLFRYTAPKMPPWPCLSGNSPT